MNTKPDGRLRDISPPSPPQPPGSVTATSAVTKQNKTLLMDLFTPSPSPPGSVAVTATAAKQNKPSFQDLFTPSTHRRIGRSTADRASANATLWRDNQVDDMIGKQFGDVSEIRHQKDVEKRPQNRTVKVAKSPKPSAPSLSLSKNKKQHPRIENTATNTLPGKSAHEGGGQDHGSRQAQRPSSCISKHRQITNNSVLNREKGLIAAKGGKLPTQREFVSRSEGILHDGIKNRSRGKVNPASLHNIDIDSDDAEQPQLGSDGKHTCIKVGTLKFDPTVRIVAKLKATPIAFYTCEPDRSRARTAKLEGYGLKKKSNWHFKDINFFARFRTKESVDTKALILKYLSTSHLREFF